MINPGARSISEADFDEENIPMNCMNKKQAKSQIDFQRANSQFGEYRTYNDLKQFKDTRTIDTDEQRRAFLDYESENSIENSSEVYRRKLSHMNPHSKFSSCN